MSMNPPKNVRTTRGATSGVTAYFDTMIYNHLVSPQQYVTFEHQRRVRSKVESGQLTVLFGMVNIDEVCANRSRPELILQQLQLMSDICDRDCFVKPHDLLLADDLNHFRWNGEAGPVFMRGKMLEDCRRAMLGVLKGGHDLDELKMAVQQSVPSRKLQFLASTRSARDATRDRVDQIKASQELPGFEVFLEILSPMVARGLTDYCGITAQCEQRGFDALLRMRSVRATVGIILSYIYGRAFLDEKIERSDGDDMKHGVPAMVASDVLITHDPELTTMLRRIPFPQFSVLTLDELLDQLDGYKTPEPTQESGLIKN
jgi:hypothetical protein